MKEESACGRSPVWWSGHAIVSPERGEQSLYSASLRREQLNVTFHNSEAKIRGNVVCCDIVSLTCRRRAEVSCKTKTPLFSGNIL